VVGAATWTSPRRAGSPALRPHDGSPCRSTGFHHRAGVGERWRHVLAALPHRPRAHHPGGTQKRGMSSCLGVRAGVVDAVTFGLGAGLAARGAALTQIGQTWGRRSPELHRRLLHGGGDGGVGSAGTILARPASAGLNKASSPRSARCSPRCHPVAVMIFLQRRRAGLFARGTQCRSVSGSPSPSPPAARGGAADLQRRCPRARRCISRLPLNLSASPRVAILAAGPGSPVGYAGPQLATVFFGLAPIRWACI